MTHCSFPGRPPFYRLATQENFIPTGTSMFPKSCAAALCCGADCEL
jgi:hypothetical protein